MHARTRAESIQIADLIRIAELIQINVAPQPIC